MNPPAIRMRSIVISMYATMRYSLTVPSFEIAQNDGMPRTSNTNSTPGALKVNGKIFAMMTSKSKLVLKLPKKCADQLVSSSRGERFDLATED